MERRQTKGRKFGVIELLIILVLVADLILLKVYIDKTREPIVIPSIRDSGLRLSDDMLFIYHDGVTEDEQYFISVANTKDKAYNCSVNITVRGEGVELSALYPLGVIEGDTNETFWLGPINPPEDADYTNRLECDEI
jgi:hypothetical protein